MASLVKVKCKKCGKYADSNSFVLDYVYKMMVCQACARERVIKDDVREVKPVEQKQEKPADWDFEDSYLDKMHRAKMGSMVKVKKIDEENVEYKCPSCDYKFIYNIEKRKPMKCPYCSANVSKITL